MNRLEGRRGRRAALAVAGVALAVLTACSGVPTNSTPEVIGPVAGGVAPSAPSVVTPARGADQHEIVQDFLEQNVSEDGHHTSARNFLTADEAKKWVDTTTSVVTSPTVGVPNLQTNAVTVTANKVGTVDAHGIYTPVTDGSGSTPITLTFGLTPVSGQWRISTVANGLVVSQDSFLQAYKPRPIYFFDQSQKRLLPDLRYSTLTAQSLCNWLLEQLIAGPRAELASAYTTNLPDPTAHAAVVYSPSVIAVDVPGVNQQLDAPTRVRLAAQLAYTFNIGFSSSGLTLTDATKPVKLAQLAQPYTVDSFPQYRSDTPSATVYYVRDGAVYNDTGTRASGPTTSALPLTSIAVASRGSSNLLAATTGKASSSRLLIGTLTGSLTPTNVPAGPLTRPAWALGQQEVWVGDDTTLYRIPSPSAAPVAVPLHSASGGVSGTIHAVALSPDGVHIALIIRTSDGGSQLWIGTITRTADGASVESLEPVTPTGLLLTDVAWNDTSALYAVGSDAGRPGSYGIWSVQVDGSLLTARPTTGLPSAPDSITTSEFGLPWVSANNTVWVQGGQENSWTPPGGSSGTTLGTNPTFLQ